jgi:hypothetical protein
MITIEMYGNTKVVLSPDEFIKKLKNCEFNQGSTIINIINETLDLLKSDASKLNSIIDGNGTLDIEDFTINGENALDVIESLTYELNEKFDLPESLVKCTVILSEAESHNLENGDSVKYVSYDQTDTMSRTDSWYININKREFIVEIGYDDDELDMTFIKVKFDDEFKFEQIDLGSSQGSYSLLVEGYVQIVT